MITKLSIKNFKSIKEMDIDCARVNLFIGEPNTGKSNILEALGLLSWCGCKGLPLNDFVRFQYTSNLFYDNLTNQIVEVNIDTNDILINIALGIVPNGSSFPVYSSRFTEQDPARSFSIKTDYINELNNATLSEPLYKELQSRNSKFPKPAYVSVKKVDREWLLFNHDTIYSVKNNSNSLLIYEHAWKFRFLDQFGKCDDFGGLHENLRFTKLYKYKQLEGDKFPDKSLSTLVHPYGSNMLTLISTTEKHRETIASFFRDFGFKPSIRPHEDSIEFEKEAKNVNINYPYLLASDTLRRMIFYNIAIDSNKDSTLIFEEPETHTFANYTKRLGEKIAFNKENQYFIVTHNPYLFLSILEKTAENEAKVFITYNKNYQTKVKLSREKEIVKLMKYDPFFNLDMLIPKK